MMKSRLLRAGALVIFAQGVSWAGSMSGATHEILPTAADSGGRDDHSSASHKLVGAAAEIGQSTCSSSSHVLQPGFAALAAWPETVLDLSAIPGAAEGSVILGWTSPKADGFTGTAAAYSVRMSSGAEPSPAESEAQFWLSLSATHYVSVPAPGAAGANEQITVAGLANGVTYYFAVKARADWDGWSYLSNAATSWAQVDSTPPNAAVLSAAMGAAEGQIELSWTVTGDNGGSGAIVNGQYEITYSSHGDFSSGVYVIANATTVAAGTGVGHTLTGLEGGKVYYAKLRLADEAANWSGYSNTPSAVAKPEAVPPNAAVLSAAPGATEGRLDLSWTVTGDDGSMGNIVNGQYEIKYSSYSDFTNTVYTITNATTVAAGTGVGYTLSGLEAGKTYYAKVRLADEVPNWSAESTPASAAVQGDVTPPGAASLVASGVGAGAIDLSWTVTGDDGSAGNIAGGQYEIKYSSYSDFTNTVYTITNATTVAAGTGVGYSLTGLEAGKTYYAKVRLADEAANWSAESSPASAIAQGDVIPPNAVTLGAATGAGHGEINLSWTVTGDDGGAWNIVNGKYEITYSSYSDFTNTVYTITNATTVAAGTGVGYTLTGLSPGITYYAKLRLADEVPNWSGESNAANAVSQLDSTPPAAVSLSAATGAVEGELNLSWTVTGDDGSSGNIVNGWYEIKYSSYSDFTNTVYTITNATTVAAGTGVGYALTGLEAGKTYYAKVRLADGVPNWSAESSPASAVVQGDVTAPAAVGLSAATGAVEGEINLSWTVTGDDGSVGNIAGGQYEIKYSSYADFSSGVVYTITNATTVAAGTGVGYRLTGLEGGKIYYARVRLADEASNWSGNSNTPNAAAQGDVTPPAAVGLSAITGAAEGEINLSWTVTGDDGSVGNIAGGQYKIVYSSYSDFTNTVYTITNATTVAAGAGVGYRLTGLEGGKTYYAKVRLADEVPNWSAESSPASAAAQGDVTAPAPVALNAAATSAEGEIDLSWTVSGDDGSSGAIAGGQYEIKYSSYSDFTNTVYTITNATTVAAGAGVGYRLTGLESGKTYYAKARLADEASNWGGESNAANATTMSDVVAPGAVANLAADPGNNQGEILLTWNATGDNGGSGNISGGKIRIDYSDDPAHAFSAASFKIELTTDTAQGASQSRLIAGLLPEVTYYIKVFLADEIPNWSAGSNLAVSMPLGGYGTFQPCNGCDILARTPTQGGRNAVSAGHYLSNTLGELGQSTFTSASHLLQPGFANLMLWPETLMTLSASTGAAEGEIDLQWIAPKADGSTGTAAAYEIRYTSTAADSPALSEAQFWLTTDYVTILSPNPPGTTEQLTLTNLARGATYYFAIRAKSSWEGWGYLSPGATSWAQVDAIAPSAIADLGAAYGPSGGSVDLTWSATGDNGASGAVTGGKYRIDCSSDPQHVFSPAAFQVEFATDTSPGQAEAYRLSGLLGGATFFVRVYLGDEAGLFSALSNGATAEARVYVPDVSTPVFSGVWSSSFTLNWSSGTGPGFNREGVSYLAEASAAADFSTIAASSETRNLSAVLGALASNTTYYVRVLAFDGANISTRAGLGSVSTLADAVSGVQVYGIWTTSITVNWTPLPPAAAEGYTLEVSTRSDFTPLWTSSQTPNVELSTLTAAGLTGGFTYFFRVGSLNWNGQANNAVPVSAALAAIYAVDVDLAGWAIGMLVPGGEAVQSGVAHVTNAGNVAQNYRLKLIEPNATWNATAAAPGAETYRFSAVFSTAAAASGNFTAPQDVVLTVDGAAGAVNYAKDDEDVSVKGYDVPPGGVRDLRFKFEAPTATVIKTQESIVIRVTTGP